jgi:hypothetical protein
LALAARARRACQLGGTGRPIAVTHALGRDVAGIRRPAARVGVRCAGVGSWPWPRGLGVRASSAAPAVPSRARRVRAGLSVRTKVEEAQRWLTGRPGASAREKEWGKADGLASREEEAWWAGRV